MGWLCQQNPMVCSSSALQVGGRTKCQGSGSELHWWPCDLHLILRAPGRDGRAGITVLWRKVTPLWAARHWVSTQDWAWNGFSEALTPAVLMSTWSPKLVQVPLVKPLHSKLSSADMVEDREYHNSILTLENQKHCYFAIALKFWSWLNYLIRWGWASK